MNSTRNWATGAPPRRAIIASTMRAVEISRPGGPEVLTAVDLSKPAPSETLLVEGGSSGIGVTAIQMAAATGDRVFATAGSGEKVAACMRLGAEKPFNYKTQDWVAEVRAATDGKGVNLILDMVGGD